MAMAMPVAQDSFSESNVNFYQSNVSFTAKHALPPLDLSFKSLLNAEGWCV